ncbi:hypothetical protein [Streptomyces sp. ISL-11]|uniref:hypothetical protein n=1 Tax=Streptomyces sp. ISL-11 TaxID=2819174 RepID=UPI001BE8E1D8|nr:hypothetical protein [Streptomyces sp. ISL-11]MBT2382096.1 hypothetical protein [Streptomyces sp. ISL-11]
MARNTSRLDWGWKVTPAAGAAMAAGGAYSVAATGGLAGLPPGYALLAAGTGALAQGGADLYQRRPHGHIITRCAAWLAAGGWTAAALTDHNAFTWNSAGWWGAGTAAAVVLARALAGAEQTAKTERVQRSLQKWANGKAGEWHKRLAELFRLDGHKVDGVTPWKGDVGYTVRVQMPEGTPELPANADRTLAAALRLPRGGGIQITDGMVYGEIQIRVTTKDVIAEEIPYPDETTVTSINDPLALGLHPDAEDAAIRLAADCALFVGQVGSGKSNLVNVANAAALRTNDTLLWHIDTTGAGISMPWLRPWAVDGTAHVPVIDWAADTVEEAHIMLDVAIAGIESRKSGYQDLMYDANDDKIPVSEDLPEIVILVDEIAELPVSILGKLDSVVDTGRAARVRVVICGLRATQDVITAAMKKQSRNRAAMRVSDPEELHHLFPTGTGRLDPKAAPHRGCGFLSSPGAEDIETAPAPFKAYRLTPKRISHLAVTFAGRRPTLDPVFLDTVPARFYASRWGRILPRRYKDKELSTATLPYTDMEILRPLIDEITGIPLTGTGEKATTNPASRTPAASAVDASDGEGESGPQIRFSGDLLSQMLDAARTVTGRHDQAPEDEANVIRAEFGRVVQQTGGPDNRPDPVPQLLRDAHQAVIAAGGRMHSGTLAAALDLEPSAFGAELNKILKTVGVTRPGAGTVRIGDDSKVGYLAETLAEAITRYRNAQ